MEEEITKGSVMSEARQSVKPPLKWKEVNTILDRLDSYKRGKEINWRILAVDDFDMICEMEEKYLTNPDECLRSEEEDIKKCLLSVCSSAIFDDDTLIGYSLAYATEYGTAYIEKSFVHPDYRGHGLQLAMVDINLGLLQGKAREVFTMTSPNNEVSRQNFRKAGFLSVWDLKYKEEHRIVMRVKL